MHLSPFVHTAWSGKMWVETCRVKCQCVLDVSLLRLVVMELPQYKWWPYIKLSGKIQDANLNWDLPFL